MSIGNNLYEARKKSGFSQEEVAAKLGVSRQTVSKWETGETLPDIDKARALADLYHLTLDELTVFDAEISEIQEKIAQSSAKAAEKIDWTKAWGKKYPVLLHYTGEVRAEKYAAEIDRLLDEVKQEGSYTEQDAMLVLKDILYQVWKTRKAAHKK